MNNPITKATRACIVRENLEAGFGVEDIALMYKLPVSAVRFEMQELRASGGLKHMFRGQING